MHSRSMFWLFHVLNWNKLKCSKNRNLYFIQIKDFSRLTSIVISFEVFKRKRNTLKFLISCPQVAATCEDFNILRSLEHVQLSTALHFVMGSYNVLSKRSMKNDQNFGLFTKYLGRLTLCLHNWSLQGIDNVLIFCSDV